MGLKYLLHTSSSIAAVATGRSNFLFEHNSNITQFHVTMRSFFFNNQFVASVFSCGS